MAMFHGCSSISLTYLDASARNSFKSCRRIGTKQSRGLDRTTIRAQIRTRTQQTKRERHENYNQKSTLQMYADNSHTIHTRTPEFYEVPSLEPGEPRVPLHCLMDSMYRKLNGQYFQSACQLSSSGLRRAGCHTTKPFLRAWFCSIRFHPLSPGVLGR